jgi:hypothetical protein
MEQLTEAVHDMFSNFYAVIAGIFTGIIGYLLPVRDIVHLMVFFFILDVIFGYWAARVRGRKQGRNVRFSASIVWKTTMPRMVISLMLVIAAYLWDTVFTQDFVGTYKVIGWFISGVLLFSIFQNGYIITDWAMFPKMSKILAKRIKDATGMDIDAPSGDKYTPSDPFGNITKKDDNEK